MKSNVTLTDGEEMNRLHPKKFLVPSETQKRAVRPRDSVKVGIEIANSKSGFGRENVWVDVRGADYPRFSGITYDIGLLSY